MLMKWPGASHLKFWPSASRSRNQSSSQRPAHNLGDGLELILDRFCEPPESWWEDGAARIKSYKFAEIAQLLDKDDKTNHRDPAYCWANRPRLFTILHNIDRLDLLDHFAAHRLTDFNLPFNEHTLPDFVEGVEFRRLFLRHQRYVLTGAHAMEEGGPHMLLDESADIYFRHINDLGQGSYGAVDHVVSSLSLRSYARKRVLRGPDSDQHRRAQSDLIEELTALKALSHVHLVQYIGSYTDKRHIGFLMSPVANMDLHRYLSIVGKAKHNKTSSLRCFYGCLAGAVEYLHMKDIGHRDLKPENILVRDDRVFISDFGTAKFSAATRRSGSQGRSVRGTPFYFAPEVDRGDPATMASDMWSLGIVFVEISTVLLGSTLQAFYNRLKLAAERAKRPKVCVFNHINEVYGWMDELRRKEAVAEQDNETLVWTRALLKFKTQQRLNAPRLMQQIYMSPSFSSYCCLDCQPQYTERATRDHELALPNEARQETATSSQDVSQQIAALFDETAIEEPDARDVEKKKTIENWITSLAGEEGDLNARADTRYANETSTWLQPSREDSYLPFSIVKDHTAATEDSAFTGVDYGMAEALHLDPIPKPPYSDESQQSTLLVDKVTGDQPAHAELPPPILDSWSQGELSSRAAWLDEPPRHPTIENPWAVEETTVDAPQAPFQFSSHFYPENVWDEDPQIEVINALESTRTAAPSTIDDRDAWHQASSQVNNSSSVLSTVPSDPHSPTKTARDDNQDGTVIVQEPRLPSVLEPEIPQTPLGDRGQNAPVSCEDPAALRPADTVSTPPIDGARSIKPTLLVHFPDNVEIVHIDTPFYAASSMAEETPEKSGVSPQTSLLSSNCAASKNAPIVASGTPAPVEEINLQASVERSACDEPGLMDDPPMVASNTPAPAEEIGLQTSAERLENAESEVTEAGELVHHSIAQNSPSAAQPTAQGQLVQHPGRLQKSNLSLLQTALQNSSDEKKKKTDESKPSARQFRVFSPEVYMQQKWEAATTQATQDNRKELANLHLTRWLEKDHNILENSCRNGKAQVVRHVLSKGCNPGTRKKPRPLPLLFAVRGGTPQHYKCVQALLKHGVNLNVKHFGTGKSALHLALETANFKGHTNLIRDLAAGGANPNISDKKGELPIHALFKSSEGASLEKYRLDALACILKADQHGDTKVNVPDPYDLNSPLHLAVSKGSPFAVGMLLYKGAKVNAVNSFGLTPLLLAATLWSGKLTSDQEVILDVLLKDPTIEIDVTSGLLKRTALHWAAFRCSPFAFRLLLEKGASASIEDAEGVTPRKMYSSSTQKTWDEEREKIDALLGPVE